MTCTELRPTAGAFQALCKLTPVANLPRPTLLSQFKIDAAKRKM